MSNLFQENKRSFLLLLALLFILLGVVYFLFLRPLMEERETAVSQVSQLSTEVEDLQIQVEQAGDEPVLENDMEKIKLEKKIPAEPKLKEFLLALQEIELVSGTKITNYAFTYDGSLPERQMPEETELDSRGMETSDEVIQQEEVEIGEEEEMGETSPILELPGLPENVRLVTVSMSLFSPDYDSFQTFLQEVEKQERVMMISHLYFEKPGEMELLETEDEWISVEMDVTTFYYEDL